jgi:hypothetical protein
MPVMSRREDQIWQVAAIAAIALASSIALLLLLASP